MPFDVDQFFGIFRAYNAATWPAPVIAWVLGLAALGPVFSSQRGRGVIIAAVLALFWVWMGVAYHWLFFTRINPAAWLFGLLFVVQGALFVALGALRGEVTFSVRGPWAKAGLALVAYAMVVYPLLGHAAGHGGLSGPQFGVAPCPTTIYTFGLLLMAQGRVPYVLLVIPAVWALIGTSAAVLLEVAEDYALFLAAVVGVLGVARLNRPSRRTARSS